MSKPKPYLGLVMIVRDEARMIAANLRYHRHLGVDRAWIFLDRCTDDTEAIVREFDWVSVIDQPRRDSEKYFSQFQSRCMALGAELAEEAGCTWLLHVDADEFARGRSGLLHRMTSFIARVPGPADGLPNMLQGVDENVQMVVLKPTDMVATGPERLIPVWHSAWTTRTVLLPRLVRDPTVQTLPGKRRHGAGYVWLKNPLGHDKGKAIIRLGEGLQPLTAHRWVRSDGENPVTRNRGLLYHYVVVDGLHWWTKYRNFADYPDHWEDGRTVGFPKGSWKKAAAQMNEEEALRYFREEVRLSPWSLLLNIMRGRVLFDPFVRRVLRKIDS